MDRRPQHSNRDTLCWRRYRPHTGSRSRTGGARARRTRRPRDARYPSAAAGDQFHSHRHSGGQRSRRARLRFELGASGREHHGLRAHRFPNGGEVAGDPQRGCPQRRSRRTYVQPGHVPPLLCLPAFVRGHTAVSRGSGDGGPSSRYSRSRRGYRQTWTGSDRRPDRCARRVHRSPSPIANQTGAAAPIAGRLRLSDICPARRLDVVWTRSLRQLPPLSFLCRSHLEGRQAGRSSRSAANEVRTGYQPQDRQGARPPNSRQAARSCQRGYRMTAKMKRRGFITLVGGAAAWPLAARAQQRERMRRIGVLVSILAADDPEWQARGNAFVQSLQERGWSDGRNVRIEYRWGLGDQDRLRKYAAELVGIAPDVILASGGSVAGPLLQASRTMPIVFTSTPDPV